MDPGRLYFATGLLWRAAMRGYWVVFAVRATVDLELPAIQLVLLGTAMELTVLLLEVPTGVVADLYSRKWSVVIGIGLAGVAQMAAGLVEPFVALLATQVLWGLAWTFQSGAETAWITDELGSPAAAEPLIMRRARYGYLTSVAGMVGAGAVAALTSPEAALVLTGALLAGWATVLAATMPERHFTRQEHASVADFLATLAAGARATAGRRGLVVLATATFLTGFASEVVDRLDIRRLEALGLGGSVDAVVVVAVIGSLEATVAAVVLFTARRRLHTTNLPTALGLFYAMSGVAIAILGLAAALPVAAAGLVLQGGLRTATEPVITAWTNAEAPSAQRATVHSFIGQADSVGQITGGVLLGVLAEVASVPTALTTSAALFVIAAAIPAGYHRQRTPDRERGPHRRVQLTSLGDAG